MSEVYEPSNELVVSNIVPGQIKTNFEPFKAYLKSAVEEYKTMEVTEDNLKQRKEDRKRLTNTRKAIDAKRKEVKKEFVEPLDEYEGECKEAMAIIAEAEKILKDQTDKFDEEKRQEKRDFYHAEFARMILYDEELPSKYKNRVVAPDWLTNVATSKKKITEYVEQQASIIQTAFKREEQNKALVIEQCKSVSKMSGLATPIQPADVAHLLGDYEDMNPTTAIAIINDTATKRREAEEAAVRRAEEKRKREELEAQEKAKREAQEAEENARIAEENTKLAAEAEKEAVMAAQPAIEAEKAKEISIASDDLPFVPDSGFFDDPEPPAPPKYEYRCHLITEIDDINRLNQIMSQHGIELKVVGRTEI